VKKRSHILTQNQELNQEVTETFQEMLQKTAQRALIALMEREVENICGESYHPVEGQQYRRAGSELGRAYYNGQSHSVRRPRVRERGEDGREQETHLKSYEASRSRKHLNEEIMKMVEGGMTLRGIERMGREGCSASTAQKAWVEESAKSIVQLRERDLSKESFYCLMMDGVVLSRGMVVIVALGFCTDGRKMVLDFVRGNTENYELCRELVARLIKRGFRSATERLLVVIDGSEALSKSIEEYFPKAHQQRCWIHKERNLHAYLNKKDHGECSHLIDRVRKAQGAVDAEAAYGELEKFLGERNQAALKSLHEAGDDLLTFHRLNVPATLNRTFLSTNPIENVMSNYRAHTNRVNKWNPKTDQVERWTSGTLLMAEEGFRRIPHHQDLPKLLEALGGLRRRTASGCVADSTLVCWQWCILCRSTVVLLITNFQPGPAGPG